MTIKREEKLPRMDTKDLNGPAPEEQSGRRDIVAGNSEKPEDFKKHGDKAGPDEKKESQAGSENNHEKGTVKPDEDHSSPATEPNPEKAGKPGPGKTADAGYDKTDKDNSSPATEPDTEKAGEPGPNKTAEAGSEESDEDHSSPATEPNPEKAGEPGPDKTADGGYERPAAPEPEKEDEGDQVKENSSEPDKDSKAASGYHNMEKEELLKVLEELIESRTVQNMRDEVEAIKVSFYKRHKAELEQKRKKFMQEGGDAEAFDPGEDPGEVRFKELYRKYRHSKAAHNRSQEQNRQSNLEEKLKVIEDLKELVNRNEDINQTFPEFRQLQKRWHAIGMVPQQNLKDLWDTYHHYVESFYDQIKINKDLRDLDLKKNLETKMGLCEKAEELLVAPNIITAFRQLQKYHDQWRETGPVPRDQKDVIWERFREVTHQINKKHQDHFDKQKETQKKNLDAKIRLCEKAEEINEKSFENFQQVEKLTKEMIGLQRTWKTIGFAPKKDNTKVYQRFRNSADRFFARKREYNTQNKELLTDNLQKKIELCIRAEALKESSEWKKTSEELIELQNRWKEIGPVPRKHYDPVWKRFRAACDHFFNRKSEFFSTIDSKYEENLKKKLAIIEKIENFKFGPNLDTNLNILKEYQREWVTIGFVPIKEKDIIQKRYRAALDKHFEGLKMDDQKKNLVKYRHKLEGVKEKPTAFNKLRFEREKFLNRFKQLESDITLWENNIGFFAKSKTADATIKEFREKIEQGKKQMEVLEEKIRMIDDLDNE